MRREKLKQMTNFFHPIQKLFPHARIVLLVFFNRSSRIINVGVHKIMKLIQHVGLWPAVCE